ncbi:unnamed protein product [Danaus chrysippus]|uniref:(African queen) hypothetical protein n=1 Tax=Danaus chrysippus TaxID=151541 RepID=A0A8J2VTZ7_9NEOP|nr:unnamed protein product [Danaus chrysippus]
MCVLLLSGIQKEELDVSVLNKLQRHNVNIHDTNNGQLLQECITLRNMTDDDTISTTVTYNTTNGITENIQANNSSSANMQKNTIESNNSDSLATYDSNIKTNNNAIQYYDGKPKLDSVLKFWNDMKFDQKITTETIRAKNDPERSYVPETKNKRDADEHDEEDDIKTLLENYFKNKKIKNGKHITEAATKRGFIDNYKDYVKSRRSNKRDDEFSSDHNLPYLLPFDGQKHSRSPLRIISDKDEGGFNHEYEDNSKYSDDKRIYQNSYQRRLIDKESLVVTTERQREKNFSQDMIKEIADSVKELVLRDLKLKLQETTAKTTTTTQTTQVTTSSEPTMDNNIKIQESVLKKFLEMFEEFKSLKTNSVVISSPHNKQNVQQLLPPAIPYGAIQKGAQMPNNNPYGYPKSDPKINFNYEPQEHKFRINEGTVTVRAPRKRLIPITFQTNNLEIPPLGIPIEKPMNPINQNIVVTTEIPYRIGVISNALKPRNNPFEETKNIEQYLSKPIHIPKSRDSYKVPINADEVRFMLNDGPKHHSNYYEKRNPKYHPRSDNTYIKTQEIPRFHERLENADILDVPAKKRYTDRVDCCNEKYSYSKQMVECCNRKIASRQQLSLNSMKKGRYDDTHFKNFLKTQQKVTDMLERILTTRDKVRSVETS